MKQWKVRYIQCRVWQYNFEGCWVHFSFHQHRQVISISATEECHVSGFRFDIIALRLNSCVLPMWLVIDVWKWGKMTLRYYKYSFLLTFSFEFIVICFFDDCNSSKVRGNFSTVFIWISWIAEDYKFFNLHIFVGHLHFFLFMDVCLIHLPLCRLAFWVWTFLSCVHNLCDVEDIAVLQNNFYGNKLKKLPVAHLEK